MENRDRQKLNREQVSRKDISKKEEEVDFGKNIGRSEGLKQPGRGSESGLGESEQGESEHGE